MDTCHRYPSVLERAGDVCDAVTWIPPCPSPSGRSQDLLQKVSLIFPYGALGSYCSVREAHRTGAPGPTSKPLMVTVPYTAVSVPESAPPPPSSHYGS